MAKDLGYYGYMVGFFGSLIIGVASAFQWFTPNEVVFVVLAIAGIVIGLMNISKEEQLPMMIASLTLMLGSVGLAVIPMFGTVIQAIFAPMAFVFVPTAFITAFNVIKERAK